MEQGGCFGFSLFEWLLVVTLLTTVSLVSLDRWWLIKQRIELENETLSLFSFIESMQSIAILENRVIIFRIYSLKTGVLFVAHATEVQAKLKELKIAQHTVLNSLSISSKFAHKGSFTVHGRHNTAKAGSLVLQNKGGITKIILSSKGRLRYCSFGAALSRIPEC